MHEDKRFGRRKGHEMRARNLHALRRHLFERIGRLHHVVVTGRASLSARRRLPIEASPRDAAQTANAAHRCAFFEPAKEREHVNRPSIGAHCIPRTTDSTAAWVDVVVMSRHSFRSSSSPTLASPGLGARRLSASTRETTTPPSLTNAAPASGAQASPTLLRQRVRNQPPVSERTSSPPTRGVEYRTSVARAVARRPRNLRCPTIIQVSRRRSAHNSDGHNRVPVARRDCKQAADGRFVVPVLLAHKLLCVADCDRRDGQAHDSISLS